jgi:CRISPR-associated protein (TIGR02710 family)
MRILILSVGGSCEPVVNAIREYKPEQVYFLCSKESARVVDGPGEPCIDTRKPDSAAGTQKAKSVVTQAGLKPEQYQKIVLQGDTGQDDLKECYLKVSGLAKEIESNHPKADVIANYTGGTKTMSVALAMAATMRERWDLSLNVGSRVDLIKVSSGTDVPVVIDKWSVYSRLQIESVAKVLARFDYAGADAILSHLSSKPMDTSLQAQLVRARQLARAFDLWDRFDHEAALAIFEPLAGTFPEHIVPLKRLSGSIAKASGYERVGDLLRNAERRAVQHRYDDAIARLYRAVELFAQVRLKTPHGIDTGNVEVNGLPAEHREAWRSRMRDDGKLVLGLREDYQLLEQLGDTVGEVWKPQEARVMDSLKRRNESIGAHGLSPMGETDYTKVYEALTHFLAAAAESISVKLDAPQLPGEEILRRLELQ